MTGLFRCTRVGWSYPRLHVRTAPYPLLSWTYNHFSRLLTDSWRHNPSEVYLLDSTRTTSLYPPLFLFFLCFSYESSFLCLPLYFVSPGDETPFNLKSLSKSTDLPRLPLLLTILPSVSIRSHMCSIPHSLSFVYFLYSELKNKQINK